MSYEISLKQSITEKIQTLIRLQNIDTEIIKVIDTKKEAEREWEALYQQCNELTTNLKQAQSSMLEISTAIDRKQNELYEILGTIEQVSQLQSESKRVEEYNIHQQKIVECRKNARDLETDLDDFNSKKQNVEDNLKIYTEEMNNYFSKFKEKSLQIEYRLEELNLEGKKLMAQRTTKMEDVAKLDKSLLQQYETLIGKKMSKVVVPIDGQSCYGCNIILTNNDIGIVLSGMSIETCEHCSRILYVAEKTASDDTAKTQKRSRRVFAQTDSFSI